MIELADAIASQRGVEVTFTCPSGNHDDKHPSASYNVEKGVWYCFSCGASGYDKSVKNAAPSFKELERLFSGDETPHELPGSLMLLYDGFEESDYWASRVSRMTARKYRCGTHPISGCATYPVHSPNGKLWGFVQRNMLDGPKYLYPKGVVMSQTLFGLHLVSSRPDYVLLCEGASDVMALDETMFKMSMGIDVSIYPLGVYGSHIKKSQASLIDSLRPKAVVIGFDGDKAGREGAEHAALLLSQEYGMFCHVVDWGEGKDPGDLTTGEQIKSISKALETEWTA